MDLTESLSDTLNQVVSFFETYGWYILFSVIVLAIIYTKFISARLEQLWESFKQRQFERDYAAKYHKNPDLFAAHVQGQQAWAAKMQEKYDREAKAHQEKLKEKEAKRLQEALDKDDPGSGQKLGRSNKPSSSLRSDYNPLMGGGAGSSYRAPKRSGCGGGGCGR